MKSFPLYATAFLQAAAIVPGLLAGQPATAATLTLPAASAPGDASAALLVSSRSPRYRDGSYTGPTYDAYYGLVQVKANVQGGRIVSVDVLQYPSDRRTSRAINSQALPMLEDEVVGAQSGRVDSISGATLTSGAYMRSLNKALAQAGS